MARDRLAVVVPTLSEAEILPELVARLIPTSGKGAEDRADELIVADGGSTDGTVELARRAGATVVQCAAGRGRQLAEGARSATAELLLFLHADSVPDEGALAATRAAFRDARVVATGMRQRVDGAGVLFRAIERVADVRVRRLGLVYGDSALAVRREAYDEVGGFRDLPIFEDVDLSRRLRRLGRVELVREARVVVSSRRWEKDGVLRRTLGNWMLTGLYLAGVDPCRLARHYQPHGPS